MIFIEYVGHANTKHYFTFIPRLHWQKSVLAQHGTNYFASVNANGAVLADTFCESVLTKHGAAQRFIAV